MIASGGTAILLERVAYRPLRRRGASRLAALISAIGASLALQEIFAIWVVRRRDPVEVPTLMGQNVLFHLGVAQVTADDVLIVATGVIMMMGLDRLVAITRLGRGIRAVAQDPETATLMGVNLDRVILYTFLIGGLMAGVAAVLYDLHYHQTQYSVGQLPGLKAFTAAVLGGIGNLRGALLGGLIIGLLEFYSASIFGSQWRDPAVFIVLVLVLLFRPTGLLGESCSGPGCEEPRHWLPGNSVEPGPPPGRRQRRPRLARTALVGQDPGGHRPLCGGRRRAAERGGGQGDGARELWPNVLSEDIGVFILLALGLNVVVGQAGMLDLGYVAFYAVGGYVLALLTTRHHWDFWFVLVLGIAIAALSGLILGLPVLRLRGDYLAIVTLGLGRSFPSRPTTSVSTAAHRASRRSPIPPRSATSRLCPTGSPTSSRTSIWCWRPSSWPCSCCTAWSGAGWGGPGWPSGGRRRRRTDGGAHLPLPAVGVRLGAAVGGSGGVFFAAQANHIDPTIFSYTVSILVLAAVVLGGSGNLAGVDPGRVHGVGLPTLPRLRHVPHPHLRCGSRGHDDLPAPGFAAVGAGGRPRWPIRAPAVV